MENSFEEFLFRYRWYLLVGGIGIILVLFGIVSITRQVPWGGGEKVEILSSEEGGEVVVEIAGAVEKPGVYTFEGGTRMENALVAAGGLSADADREWVGKVLNRAAKLTDGQKIYIPEKGEANKPSNNSTIQPSKNGSSIVKWSYGQMVKINTATQAELEALPGIGPVTAQKIIENRPYSGVEELITRKILKKSVYEENKDKLSVY